MLRVNRTHLIAAAIAAITVALVVTLLHDEPSRPDDLVATEEQRPFVAMVDAKLPEPDVPAPQVLAFPGVHPATIVLSKASPVVRATPVESGSLTAFYASADVAEFMRIAAQKPTIENLRLAAMAANECDSLLNLAGDGTQYSQSQQEMLDRANARCAAYDYTLIKRIRSAVVNAPGVLGGLSGDPGSRYLESVTGVRASALDRERGISVVEGMTQALVQSSSAVTLVQAASDLATRDVRFVLNEESLSPSEQSAMSAALLISTCDLGARCDRAGPFMAKACISYGYCDYDNMEDLFRSLSKSGALGVFLCCGGRTVDFNTVMELRSKISRGILDGNLQLRATTLH